MPWHGRLQWVIKRSYWYMKHYQPPVVEPGTYPHFKKQIPERAMRKFEDRKAEIMARQNKFADYESINIGREFTSVGAKDDPKHEKIANLEKLARTLKLTVDLDAVERARQQSHFGIESRYALGLFYGIYADLFDGQHLVLNDINNQPDLAAFYASDRMPLHYFMPVIDMNVAFSSHSLPVHCGNVLEPNQLQSKPKVGFPMEKNKYYSWILTCPDEQMHQTMKEIVHAATCNISLENELGDEIISYFPPIPPAGTGFHRYIFVLFEHDEPLHLDDQRRSAIIQHLDDRSFCTYSFYRSLQDVICPVGFSFFQASWDESVRQYYRQQLKCEEPSYEFKWPREYRPPQKRHPEEESFNLYLDKYRDKHDLQEEVLLERLKMIHPFKKDPKPLPYPNAVVFPNDMPSWLREKEREKNTRKGIWKDLVPPS